MLDDEDVRPHYHMMVVPKDLQKQELLIEEKWKDHDVIILTQICDLF